MLLQWTRRRLSVCNGCAWGGAPLSGRVRHKTMWPFQKPRKDGELDKKRREAFGLLAAVSSMCIGPDRLPVMHGVREKPNNVSDSGWILASGRESKKFAADPGNYKLVPLERMLETDDTLAPLRELPLGTEITRLNTSEPWRFIVNDQVVDEDGKIVGGLRE